MADLIPTEIWFNHIFMKLPVKSLLRCKFVCKAWNAVVSDPDFVSTHFHLHPHHQHVLLQLSDLKISSSRRKYFSVDTLNADAVKLNLVTEDMTIIGSSNGLVCGRISNSKKDDLAILNPSTGDFKLIPDGPRLYPNIYRFGFLYDFSIDDGNIVYFTSLNPKKSTMPLRRSRIDIYSIKTNSWRIVEKFDPHFGLYGVEPITQGCGMNGSIYWVVKNKLRCPKFIEILVFNIKHNKFKNVQVPRGCKCRYDVDLIVLGSSLGLYRFSTKKGLVMWKLKEGENEEWIKFMHINASFLRFQELTLLQPICLMTNTKVLLLYRRKFQSKTKFMLYDPESKEIEALSVRGIRHGFPRQGVAYVESLVSLNNISRDDRITADNKANESYMVHKRQRLM